MNTLLTWMRSWGTAGAVANAGQLRLERQRDEWVLRALALRMRGAVDDVAAA